MKRYILSIDGGGIRGVIPATILAYLESRLQTKLNNNSVRIADFFDLFAGTSAGAILTTLYLLPNEVTGRPCYSAQEIQTLYKDLGPKIFKRTFVHKIKSGFGLFSSLYPHKELEKFASDIFAENTVNVLLKDFLISSYDIERRKALFFSKVSVRKYGSSATYKIKDILRAATAAPTYFSPALIYDAAKTHRHLIDGGVFANNPSMCAYVEAIKLWPGVMPKDEFILSLGTGKVEIPYLYKKMVKLGVVGWLLPIIDILMSSVSEVVDYQTQQIFTLNGVQDNYKRIEPPLLNADSRMDNASPKNIRALINATESFIEHNEQLFDKIISEIISKEESTSI